MPTYEYSCKKCGEQFEIFQSFSARPMKKHPKCGGELQKVFHARGVVFKGSGFYATDSKPRPKEATSDSTSKETPSKSGSSSKAATSESSKSSSSKTDTSSSSD